MLEMYPSTEEYKSVVYPAMALHSDNPKKDMEKEGKFRDSKKEGWEAWNYFFITIVYHLHCAWVNGTPLLTRTKNTTNTDQRASSNIKKPTNLYEKRMKRQTRKEVREKY